MSKIKKNKLVLIVSLNVLVFRFYNELEFKI